MEQFVNQEFFRAKVVNSKDPERFGRVLIWIPDLMPSIPQNEGIWARPANNAIGGRNLENEENQYFLGSCFIPQKGSWILIFFEKGNPNFPYYISSLDLENDKTLPECQLGNYDKKWVIFKSHQGRCIIISDDPSDERIEVTGKKRLLTSPPSGDTDSVYTIDDNQTTILFDEREDKEKILIRTYKGDFIHLDIDSQKLQISFESDIDIKSRSGNININGENINIKGNNNVNIQAIDNLNLKADNINLQSETNINLKSSDNINIQSSDTINMKATTSIASDASLIQDNCGASSPASSASESSIPDFEGERDT